MTFFIVVGMIIVFVIGLFLICGSIFGLMYTGAWTGRIRLSEYFVAGIMFCLGLYAWYFVFSHVSIGIG